MVSKAPAPQQNNQSTPPWRWDFIDQATAGVALAFVFVLMGMGMTTVYSILIDSGTPAFIERPYLAWALSFIVPAASLGVKFGYDMIDTDLARRFYGQIVYVVAFAFLVIWVITFAANFGGLNAGIDWDTLGETSTGKGRIMTAVQLLAEIFNGAALFMVVSNIAAKYSAETLYHNPQWSEVKRSTAQAEKELDSLLKQQKAFHGKREKFKAARKVFIASCIAEWISIQGKPSS